MTPSCTQCALCTGDFTFPPRNLARGGTHRDSESLECTLGAMMIVLAPEAVYVEGDAGSLGEALHGVGDHLAAQVANLLALEAKLDDTVGSVREVDNGTREGLVEGCVGKAVAGETSHAGEGLCEGVTESDADIFRRVMVIN